MTTHFPINRYARSSLLAAATTLLLAPGASTPALAGADNSTYFTGRCDPQGNNIMECTGSMSGIRAQTADPGRAVSFGRSLTPDYTLLSFNERFNGVDYYCYAPNTSAWNAQWNAVLMTNAWYSIRFNMATGVCTSLSVSTGSSQKSATAL